MPIDSTMLQCPYYDESLIPCGIRYSHVCHDKGMQSAVCFTEKHTRCRWFRKRDARQGWRMLCIFDEKAVMHAEAFVEEAFVAEASAAACTFAAVAFAVAAYTFAAVVTVAVLRQLVGP